MDAAKPASVALEAHKPVDKPSETAPSAVTEPLPVAPEAHKPVDTPAPAAVTNGGGTAASGLNGAANKFESVVPEEPKQASAAAPPTEKPAEPPVNNIAGATSSSSANAQPPVMTGALPLGGQPKSDAPASETSSQHDGIKDALAASSTPAGISAPKTEASDGKETVEDTSAADSTKTGAANTLKAPEPSAINGGDKSKDADVEMKDAPAAASPITAAVPSTAAPGATVAPIAAPLASHPVSAPVTDVTSTASTTAMPALGGLGGEVAGEKRKAGVGPVAGSNGAAVAEEPAEKKQKGPLAKVLNKAKEAVEEVKEKTTPARKNSKKAKKDPAPVGRTERKTRSQGHAE